MSVTQIDLGCGASGEAFGWASSRLLSPRRTGRRQCRESKALTGTHTRDYIVIALESRVCIGHCA